MTETEMESTDKVQIDLFFLKKKNKQRNTNTRFMNILLKIDAEQIK